jgi:hypothetical protein
MLTALVFESISTRNLTSSPTGRPVTEARSLVGAANGEAEELAALVSVAAMLSISTAAVSTLAWTAMTLQEADQDCSREVWEGHMSTVELHSGQGNSPIRLAAHWQQPPQNQAQICRNHCPFTV